MQVYNRKKQTVETEEQYQAGLLHFLYETKIGRILLKLFISTPLFSKMYAFKVNSSYSKKKIAPFIQRYTIDMNQFKAEHYPSFNDFFIRQLKPDLRSFSTEKKVLCSPADARLQIYPISENLVFNMKNSYYSVDSLIRDEQLSQEYKNGLCLVFRLTVTDYHRYCYFDNGTLKKSWPIAGRLHTVSPISFKTHQVYAENSRICSLLKTENFGEVIQIEVGALLVGRITNHPCEAFQRGDEKGYFSYGGSTIILLFKEEEIQMDQDLLEWTQKGVECSIQLGEKIGVGKKC